MASVEEVDEFVANAKSGSYQGIPLPHGRALAGKDLSATAEAVLGTDLTGKTVLDVGAHHGYFSLAASQRGASRVVAVEPNPVSRSICQSVSDLWGGAYEVVGGSTNDLPDGPFDLVLLLSVIHHIPDPVIALRNLATMAARQVVIEVPPPEDPSLIRRLSSGRVRERVLGPAMRFAGRALPLAVVTPHRGLYFSPGAFENMFVTHHGLFSSVRFVPSPVRRGRVIAFCTLEGGSASQ